MFSLMKNKRINKKTANLQMDSALVILVSILHYSVKSINMYILFQNNGFPTAQMRVDCFVPITTVKCYISLKSYFFLNVTLD